ncbi:MAG: homoserine O-succinyltransferase [Candidatus Latescibacteria bacterium]|nr:homoserine O-succinyltransferase [Candidatus Latescibacterota bacterium]MBT4137463.1 homoserine O-succinyltransferase [Candidatus Latescibacterota bacterium]
MPLVAHTSLPSFEDLRNSNEDVLTLDSALHQDIRELHIGFLNMMPDAALRATERQFLRLVGSCNQIAQFFVYPFTVPGLPRGEDTQAYIDQYYYKFEDLQKMGLDALIITGANVANPTLEEEPFWEPLKDVVAWGRENVVSMLCSCLSTHALVKQLYEIDRCLMPQKLWGVYPHRIKQAKHPLLRGINTRFDVPHSRYNTIPVAALEDADVTVLIESDTGEMHMAVSADQFSIVYFQGHPEYDANSLLKEYKREVNRYILGDREDYPPHPEHYFSSDVAAFVDDYGQLVRQAQQQGKTIPSFPEEQITPLVDNTWGDTGKAIVNNWLGLVYQKADYSRPNYFETQKTSSKK